MDNNYTWLRKKPFFIFLNINLKAYKIVRFFFAAMSCANARDIFFKDTLKRLPLIVLCFKYNYYKLKNGLQKILFEFNTKKNLYDLLKLKKCPALMNIYLFA